jgi:hypothetical protein
VTVDLASAAGELAGTALRTVRQEFPYDLRVVYDRPGAAPERPRDRHPAFWGSYDWHSAVEMHWVLVRLQRLHPQQLPPGTREVLDEHLTAANLAAEAASLAEHPWQQRPYGWGWVLTLHEETVLAGEAAWTAALQPLADLVLAALAAWLPAARYPVRHGVHPNSAFGLVRALPAARRAGTASLVEDAARRWFAGDRDAPTAFEPSGSDFLSPTLTEAVLMSEVLPAGELDGWLTGFLPGLAEAAPFAPAVVGDASDGQTAHLHGLNLSRAWALRRLATAVGDGRADVLRAAAEEHAAAALPHVSGSHYMVEHWLAAFALLALDPDL